MDGISAEVTGTIITPPEVRRTNGGRAWMRVSVVADTERDAETIVRVSMQGPDVPDVAPQLVVGVRVFCSGGLTLRYWRTPAGESRAGLSLTARRIDVIRDRQRKFRSEVQAVKIASLSLHLHQLTVHDADRSEA